MSLLKLADTCRLYYQMYDSAKSKPVVVFLNGTTQTTKSWGMQTKGLQGHFRILLYDARGQGQSDLGVNDLTIDGHVDDLIQLLDYLDVDSSHLVGLSHGARLACALCQLYPERTDKMVLCGLGNDLGPRTSAILESWHQILKSSNLETLVWAMLPVVFGEPFLEKHKTNLNAMVIRVIQGSATVAMVTAAGMIAPVLSGLDYSDPHKALIGIAIAAGSCILSHVNDSGFWLVKKYLDISEKETLQTWTVLETIISLTGFFLVLILSLFI